MPPLTPTRRSSGRTRAKPSRTYAGLATADRGKLIMACGTGKTFTSSGWPSSLSALVAASSSWSPISLLSQTLREWATEAEVPSRPRGVLGSEATARSKAHQRGHFLPSTSLLPSTTNIAVPSPDGPRRRRDRLDDRRLRPTSPSTSSPRPNSRRPAGVRPHRLRRGSPHNGTTLAGETSPPSCGSTMRHTSAATSGSI